MIAGYLKRLVETIQGGGAPSWQQDQNTKRRPLPPSFHVVLPQSDVDVQVDLVWSSRTSDGVWMFGAALSEANQTATQAWHGLVDTLA